VTKGANTKKEQVENTLEGSTEAAQFHAPAAVPKSSEKLSARVAAD